MSGQKDAEICLVRARNRLFTPHAGSRQRSLHDEFCLFSPLKSSVVMERNTNRNICSMANTTKMKAKRACKSFHQKEAKEKMKLVGSSCKAPYILCVLPMVTNRRQAMVHSSITDHIDRDGGDR